MSITTAKTVANARAADYTVTTNQRIEAPDDS